ncbi:MAG: WG repeat-containing protein, partial [Elusimicrobiales bacterium]|nr:WG repeat-containing protein [Elusimicrobiales bacterium]
MKNIFTLLFIIIFNYKVNSLDLVPCINRNVNKSNVIDLCNKDGEEDFAFTGKKELYHKISKFKSNLIPVMLNSKWGVITRQRNTNLVHKCIGKCPQISQNNIYFLVIPFEYELINECSDKYCIAVKNSKWGIIDSYNKTIIDFKYEYLEFSDDLILAKKNKLYGFIDTNEKNMISFKYDFAKTFSNKLAPVYISKKCGYIDKDGKMVISPIYDECNSFSKEITSVKKNNLWGYIDKVGKTVIPFNFEAANPFYNGIASVKEK